jgi:AcrR family transcriptional regulator
MPSAVSHRRGEHVRQVVLDAAFDELVENGAKAATVAGVARRCGVHETTIYRRWITRENLLVDAMLARGAQSIPDPDTGSTRGDMLAVARSLAAYLNSPAGKAVLDAGTLRVDDNYDKARHAFWRGRFEALAPVVDRGVARGELRAETDARLVMEMVLAPLHSQILLFDEPIPDDMPEHLVNVLLDGAAARASDA